jgi:heat shock protein HtpX
LRKIELAARQVPPAATVSPSQAHMFIVNPFSGRSAAQSFAKLFRTHPPTEDRIARLQEIAQKL